MGLLLGPSPAGSQAPGVEGLDHSRLLFFRDPEGRVRPVRTPRDWEARRTDILRGLEEAMGPLPDRTALPPLVARELARVEGDVYERVEISLVSEGTDRIPAYLYLPRPREPGRRYPAILALHPTSPLGKGIPAGLGTDPNRAYGLELARRGYVVLAPDYPSFGDYPYDFQADRYPSGTMKGIFNHLRCVDLLAARSDVDPERIGVVGHSLGGHNAMFAAVFDPRLKVVVSSCGWTPFHDYYGGRIGGWTSHRYMPRLRDAYGLDPDRVPFDFYEVVAALAPRPFFSSSPLHDENFDVDGVRKAAAEARRVYRLLGAEDRLQVRHPDCGHDFPPAARLDAYRFIDQALGHEPLEVAARERLASSDPAPRAGFAAADITPPVGWRLSGYFTERVGTARHDPLLAKALVLRQGGEQAALCLCDLIGLPLPVSRQAREEASRRTGIPAERIVVAATHTHTGPLYFGPLRQRFHEAAVAREGRDPHEPLDYAAGLAAAIADTVARAQALAAPVRIESARAEVHGLSFNRRFHMRDGTVRFNPGKLNPAIVRPAGPIDPALDVLFLRDRGTGTAVGSLSVFALHLDTAGGTEYSADFPFHLEEALRAAYGPEYVSIFAAGPCGDINHIDVSHERPQKGQEEARRIGRELAAHVREALAEGRVLDLHLGGLSARVRVPLQRFAAADLAWAREALARIGTGELPFLEEVRAFKIAALALRGSADLELEVQVLRLSDDLALVALPGEVFGELGLEIKKASPFPRTVVLELAGDAPGYIPTRKAFAEGSYETVNSRVEPGGGEALVETVLRLLRALKAG